MIVGEGRAGKTAFSNSIIGKSFEETVSTIGINQLTCDIKYASAGDGAWSEYKKPDKEWEAAVASLIAHQEEEKPISTTKNDVVATPKEVTKEKANVVVQKQLDTEKVQADTVVKDIDSKNANSAPSDPKTSSEPKAHAPSSGVTSSSPSQNASLKEPSEPSANLLPFKAKPLVKDSPPPLPPPSAKIDDEIVMKCLADSVHTESKLILSVFDYGGQSVFNVIHHFFLTRYGVYCLVFNMVFIL